MAISLREQSSDSVLDPDDTEGLLYVNDAGKFVVRLADGSEKEAQAGDGSPIFLENQAATPSVLGKFGLFSRNIDGAANLHAVTPDGTVIQFTGGGGLTSGALGPFFVPTGKVEQTFETITVDHKFEWFTDLHFVIPDEGWSIVPVWVEAFASGSDVGAQGMFGALYVFLFAPGPGTPQSRISPMYPGYVAGVPGLYFQSYLMLSFQGYYNSVENGDELRILFLANVFADISLVVHVTATMGTALTVPDPTPVN